MVGRLTVFQRSGTEAQLIGRYGIDLARLQNVRIRAMQATGCVLLHGTELHQVRTVLRDDPQAWWCVPFVDQAGTP